MNLLDVLDFKEMVSAAQRSNLRPAPLFGAIRHLVDLGFGQRSFGLGKLGVAGFPIPVVDHPARALNKNFVQVLEIDLDETGSASAARHVTEDLVQQLSHPWPNVRFLKVGADQTHAAVDVETDAARRDDARGVVGGANTADRESVALVNVRHSQTGADDSRERRHVGRLFEGFVLGDFVDDRFGCVDDNIRAHTRLAVARKSPAVVVQPFELFSETHGAKLIWRD